MGGSGTTRIVCSVSQVGVKVEHSKDEIVEAVCIVESVMDSGASAPVAPPSVCPNVPVLPSAGSRRG